MHSPDGCHSILPTAPTLSHNKRIALSSLLLTIVTDKTAAPEPVTAMEALGEVWLSPPPSAVLRQAASTLYVCRPSFALSIRPCLVLTTLRLLLLPVFPRHALAPSTFFSRCSLLFTSTSLFISRRRPLASTHACSFPAAPLGTHH